MPMTEAQKKAIYKYREKNRDKINAQARKQYEKTKTNPELMTKRKAYAKKYYNNKIEEEETIYWNDIAQIACIDIKI